MAKGKTETIGSQNVRLKKEAEQDGVTIDELELKLKESNERAEFFENKASEPAVPEAVSVPAPDLVAEHVASELEPEVLHDPYDSQNPHKFIAHPQGFKLGWKNPSYRDNHRGWRGWVQVEYNDFIGKRLNQFLLDPPRRMEHAVDNYVRRGDSILCHLPIGMWEARQQKRLDKANRASRKHAPDLQVEHPVGGKFAPIEPDSTGRRIGGSSMTS